MQPTIGDTVTKLYVSYVSGNEKRLPGPEPEVVRTIPWNGLFVRFLFLCP